VFSQRLIQSELLDYATPEEARLNLADLVRINRKFGGHAVLRRSMARLASAHDRFTLLDVGAASGDAARVIQDAYPFASITNLDYSRVNLNEAPPPKVIGDAFQLPFLPQSFDYVLCSLFIHHFTDEQARTLLRTFYAVARRALVVCDLERHVLPYCFLPVTRLLFGWQRITLHDGPISVRASFRREELVRLLKSAGIEDADVEVHRPAFRISVVARKTTE
jgi:ubiquinone/menaquinone biosynthesis C-methylase UbiE